MHGRPAGVRPLLAAIAGLALGCGGSQEPLNPSLRVRDIDPRSGPSTGGGTLVVSGRAFSADVNVRIAGVSAPVDEVLSDRRVRVRIPSLAGRIGLADVEVSKGSETSTLRQAFRIFAASVDFDTYRAYRTEFPPVTGALGDLRGTGLSDLVIGANSNDGSDGALIVLSASSAGVFSEPVTVSRIPRPSGIAVADFDRDGLPDIAVSDFAGDRVLVFRNAGGGAFSPPTALPTEECPAGIIAGDLDGDGQSDVAVANSGSDSVSVFRGDASSPGAFLPPVSILLTDPDNPPPNPKQPGSIAVGELDGNGTLDLAVGNVRSSDVTLVFSLAQRMDLAAGGEVRAVQIADVDGDGLNDILFVKAVRGIPAPGSLGYLRNLGGRAFDVRIEFPVGRSPFSIAAADFSGDGRLDVAVGNRFSNDVMVYFGTGDPTTVFASDPLVLDAGNGAGFLLASRLDPDERPDLVVLNEDGRDASVLFGEPMSSFRQPRSLPLPGTPLDVVQADTDGDAIPDCIVALGADGIAVLQRAPLGGLSDPVVSAIPGSPALLAPLSGRRIACAGAADGLVRVLFASPSGLLEESPGIPPLPGVPSPGRILKVDLDQDGRDDLVIGSASDGTIRVLRSRADGGFDPLPTLPAVGSCVGLAAADWNRDGRIDLAVADGLEPQIRILFGLGDGDFALPPLPIPIAAPATALLLLEGGGPFGNDLLVGESNLGHARRLVATGTGSFTTGPTHPLSVDASRFVLGDWDFDGRIDLLAVQPSGSVVTMFLGQADGGFAASRSFGVGEQPVAAVAFDLNGALPADIVVAAGRDRSLTLLTNRAR